MKPLSRILSLGLCVLVALTALILLTPAYARYSNVTSTAVSYGHTELIPVGQTLSTTTAEYDFGVYYPGVDEDAFSHTICLSDDEAVSGILRFSWDESTRINKDIALYIESTYYTSMESGDYIDYVVSAADGDLRIPFSLLFASPATDRVAVLDVSWYPEGSVEPTLSARYRLAVPAIDPVGDAPNFDAENTSFLTDRLLEVTVTIPVIHAGVTLAPTDGVFTAGTRYFSDDASHGVTLLRDSALFLERTGDSFRLLMDLSAHLSDDTPLSMTVGVSDTLFSTYSCTPFANASALTVTLSDMAGVLSPGEPLVVTLTESTAFRDSDWSQQGSTPCDLSWEIQRYKDGVAHPITEDTALTVTATQTQRGGTLKLEIPDGKRLPAGTYLVMVTQYYYGCPVLETPIWFFVDYR